MGARVVAAHERLQHLLLARIRNAGTVVLDVDDEPGALVVEADRDLGAPSAHGRRQGTVRCKMFLGDAGTFAERVLLAYRATKLPRARNC
jgi:hypothetical protein